MSFKKYSINFSIIFASLLSTFLFVEIIFRFLGIGFGVFSKPDPLLGCSLIPGARYRQTVEGFSQGKINSKGLRDVEHDYAKPPNTYRILLIGDSFTEALQVVLDSTYFRRLSKLLNGNQENVSYEIIAMGRSGMGTLEEMLWYKREGRKYNPDLVLCAFYVGNDFRDNSREITQGRCGKVFKPFLLEGGAIDTSFVMTKSFKLHSAMVPLLRWSRLLTFIVRKIEVIRMKKSPDGQIAGPLGDLCILRKKYSEPWQRAIHITSNILSMFNSEVKKDNARFVVFGIPDSYQINGPVPPDQYRLSPEDFDNNKPDSLLAGMASTSGFDFFPLSNCFKSAFESNKIYYYGFGSMLGSGHWNENGHALAAECLFRRIKQIVHN